MATVVVLPKQGNSVESCIIVRWLKNVGDAVKDGDGLCEVETDKATVEVPATASGTLLAQVRKQGEDVPVQTPIAIIGATGEDISGLLGATPAPAAAVSPPATASASATGSPPPASSPQHPAAPAAAGASPRAREAAAAKGVDVAAIAGTGPGGLVIERDVAAAPRMTPAAAAAGGALPASGTGLAGTITAADRATPAGRPDDRTAGRPDAGAMTDIPVKSIRKVIAERMRQSIGSTAQLTLNTTAKATAMNALRARYKAAGESVGLAAPSVNDLILLAVARTLPKFPAVNAHFLGDKIRQFSDIHLGVAVDTERGLMVPVVKDASRKSVAEIGKDVKALAKACQEGSAKPEQLSGSTFTVTNLGALGIEHFTPVLNVPEVAILGVGGIVLRPYEGPKGVEFIPSIALSLTIDHQGLDGAPAARFLQALVRAIEAIDLVVAA
jgi:pyruvate dehydrogenase E2 component (dihydrolipoamide acetyltransferase)